MRRRLLRLRQILRRDDQGQLEVLQQIRAAHRNPGMASRELHPKRACRRGFVKTAMLAVGVLLLLYGLHWIGQGTGWLPWPAHTIMDYNMAFTWYGLGLTGIGALLIWYSRR
jgi:hypothetical protein